MTSALRCLARTSLLGAACAAGAADAATLAKRLHNAADASSLDDPALKPWHVKLDVQLYDDKGEPSEKGTIEEWWTPEKDKRVYTTPGYTATEIRDGKALYRSTGTPNTPYLLDVARRIVVHPLVPSEVIDKSDLEAKAIAFGKTKLDCIMLEKAGGDHFTVSAGVVQTYCFSKDDDHIRTSWLDPEIDFVNGTGTFQGKVVGASASVALFEKKALDERVEVLTGFTPEDAVFSHGSGFEDRTAGPVWLSPGAVAGSTIKKVPPKYPEKAKANHISGTVVMEATIGKDGQIKSLKLVGHPDASLSKAALDAVKDWVYKPYMVDGVAMEVQTWIKINFNFSYG